MTNLGEGAEGRGWASLPGGSWLKSHHLFISLNDARAPHPSALLKTVAPKLPLQP